MNPVVSLIFLSMAFPDLPSYTQNPNEGRFVTHPGQTRFLEKSQP
jgi:hypothetical protein